MNTNGSPTDIRSLYQGRLHCPMHPAHNWHSALVSEHPFGSDRKHPLVFPTSPFDTALAFLANLRIADQPLVNFLIHGGTSSNSSSAEELLHWLRCFSADLRHVFCTHFLDHLPDCYDDGMGRFSHVVPRIHDDLPTACRQARQACL